MSEDKRERALKHIADCDSIFDHTRRPDREFAYYQMRLLALELLEELEFAHASPRKRLLMLWRELRGRLWRELRGRD